jgi:hypothetical protein
VTSPAAAPAAPDSHRGLRWAITNWLLGDHLRVIEDLLYEQRSDMATTQADLDNLATELVGYEGSIQTAITDLEAQIAAGNTLDLTNLQRAVDGAAQLVPSTLGGGTGPVADDPSTPVVPDPTAGDGSGSTGGSGDSGGGSSDPSGDGFI